MAKAHPARVTAVVEAVKAAVAEAKAAVAKAKAAVAKAKVAVAKEQVAAEARAEAVRKTLAPIQDPVQDLYSLIIKSVISGLQADTSSTTKDHIRMAGDISRLLLQI